MTRHWVIAPVRARPPDRFDNVWQFDLANNIITIGWPELGDISNMSHQALSESVAETYPERPAPTRLAKMLWRFYNEIGVGDLVIARRGRMVLAAVGEVTRPAVYSPGKNPHINAPNVLGVSWRDTPRDKDFGRIVFPISTVTSISEERFQNLVAVGEPPTGGQAKEEKQEAAQKKEEFLKPFWLLRLLGDIEMLKKDASHQERAHEALVEAFYEAIGYKRYEDIKHRQGRIDIAIHERGDAKIVNEVKRDWGLSVESEKTVDQAYRYANRTGARFVVITNGDYYGVFDRESGLSIKDNYVGEFRLSQLNSSDIGVIDLLTNKSTSESG